MELDFEKIIDDGGARAWRAVAAIARPIDHPRLRIVPVEEIGGGVPRQVLGARSALEEIRTGMTIATINPDTMKQLDTGSRAHSAAHQLLQWNDHAPEDALSTRHAWPRTS
jgi:hypothetical protein